MFKVLRNGMLRYILSHMSKPVIAFVFKVLRNDDDDDDDDDDESIISTIVSGD